MVDRERNAVNLVGGENLCHLIQRHVQPVGNEVSKRANLFNQAIKCGVLTGANRFRRKRTKWRSVRPGNVSYLPVVYRNRLRQDSRLSSLAI